MEVIIPGVYRLIMLPMCWRRLNKFRKEKPKKQNRSSFAQRQPVRMFRWIFRLHIFMISPDFLSFPLIFQSFHLSPSSCFLMFSYDIGTYTLFSFHIRARKNGVFFLKIFVFFRNFLSKKPFLGWAFVSPSLYTQGPVFPF